MLELGVGLPLGHIFGVGVGLKLGVGFVVGIRDRFWLVLGFRIRIRY